MPTCRLGFAILISLVLTSASSVVAAASSTARFEVLQRWVFPGEGGWDYLTLDARGERLFVTRGSRVEVVDTKTGKLIGSIAGIKGVHGVALAPDLKRGFTSNGKGDSITVFDLDTLATIQEVAIPGHNPDAIIYEPVGKHLFTFNGKSKDVTVLDATTFAIVATLPVADKPEFAVDDGAGHIYFNIESEAGKISVLDTRTLKIRDTWTLPGCASPSGLSLDQAQRRLFSVCDDKIMVVTNADTGAQVARVGIGEGPDAVAYDAIRRLVLSSNGEGTLSIIQQVTADQYKLLETLKTQRGARTMAHDSLKGRTYLVSADFGPASAATAENPHPRSVPLRDTFTVLVVGKR